MQISNILTVYPGNPLIGEISLPGDKSLSHRAALLAALADGESVIHNFLIAGVTDAMLRALTALSIPWRLDGTTLTVQGAGVRQSPPSDSAAPIFLDCGNSATTLRLLAGALAAMGTPVVLDGSPGLRRRPMNRIVQPLQQMGVNIQSNQGCAPLHLLSSPYPLKPLEYTLPVASAQVKSCLLLAALAASAPTTLHEPTLSRDHTERMLQQMGVQVLTGSTIEHPQSDHPTFSVTLVPPSPLVLSPLHMTLPGDISAAAFLIVAALITPGSEIVLRGVGLNPTRTGLLDALAGMGADIQIQNFISGEADKEHPADRNPGGETVGDLHVRYSSLRGTQVDGELVTRMIDEFPVFAVAAACARGDTVVAQADELRHKESDRITALCQELRLLNVEVDETPDGFIVHGDASRLNGNPSPLQTHGDHRLAMSLVVAGLAARESVTIADPGIISESFPAFVETLRSLGAKLS